MTVYELAIFSYQCLLDIIELLGALLDNFLITYISTWRPYA